MKPDEVLGALDATLLGFNTTANAPLTGGTEWKKSLSEARGALDAALAGKDGASMQAGGATAELAAARKGFLTAYNGVAKRVIRGMLADLGRSKEYRTFFRDLQINEGRAPGEPDNVTGTELELPGTDLPASETTASAVA